MACILALGLVGCASSQPGPPPAPAPFLQGVVVPMVTPFREDGSLDEAGVTALTEWLCAKPIGGLFPMGATGEWKHLTVPERRRISELVIASAKRRVPVVPHVGAGTLEETLELARHAEQAGADGVGVIVPEGDGDLFEYLAAVDRAVAIPLVVYDPRPSITPELMARLTGLEGLRAIKYRSKDMRETMRMVAAGRGRIALLAGHEGYVLPTLAVGGCGVIGGGANLFPGPMSEVCRRWEAGERDAAIAAQLRLDELGGALGGSGEAPLSLKLGLARLGLQISPVTREPCREPTPEETTNLEQLCARLGR